MKMPRIINTHTFPLWVIDFYDGNLNELETARFLEYLKAHPEKEEEFIQYQPALHVQNEDEKGPSLSLSFIQKLKKIDSNEEFDQMCFDALENKEDQDKEEKLKSYIKHHPEKEKEAKIWSQIHIESAMPSLSWTHLHRIDEGVLGHLSEQTLTTWCIAEFEGLLNEADLKKLHIFISQNPNREAEGKRIQATDVRITMPSLSVSFQHLKKKNRILPLFNGRFAAGVAASLLLMAGYFYVKQEVPQHGMPVAMLVPDNPVKPKNPIVTDLSDKTAPKQQVEYSVQENIHSHVTFSKAGHLDQRIEGKLRNLKLTNTPIDMAVDLRPLPPIRNKRKLFSIQDSGAQFLMALRDIDELSREQQLAERFNTFFKEPIIDTKSLANSRKPKINYGIILQKASRFISRHTPLNLKVYSKEQAEDEDIKGIVVGEYQISTNFR